MKSPPMELQPLFEFQILLHPTPARVEKEKTILQRLASAEVRLNQTPPFGLDRQRHLCISISRQVHKVNLAVNPVKVDRLGAARESARKSQSRCTAQTI